MMPVKCDDRSCLNVNCEKTAKPWGYFCSIECEVEHTEHLNSLNNDSNVIKAE